MQQQPLLQLIDEEEWFSMHALRSAGGSDNEENESERMVRDMVDAERAYQNEVHARIFAEDDAKDNDENNCGSEGKSNDSFSSICANNKKRRRQLDEWENDEVDILTSNNGEKEGDKNHNPSNIVVVRTNLKELASRSDTVFIMAANKHLYNNNNTKSSGKNNNSNGINDNRLSLSLCDYSTESVKILLRILLSSPSSFSSTATTTSSTSTTTTTTTSTSTDLGDDGIGTFIIPPDHVIECCRLSHYLQCHQVMDAIVNDYLIPSVDDNTCRFLCQFADELSLPNLWEMSVNHMLSSLDRFNDNYNDDHDGQHHQHENQNEIWDDMTPALKREIQALRTILKSSNRKRIYFSTYHEYLALLAEQLQYYKERLQDAVDSYTMRLTDERELKKEIKTLQDEREANWTFGYRNNIRLDRKIANAECRLAGLTKAREYVKPKIDRQERKIDRLKILLEEQKVIFGGDDGQLGFRRFTK